MVNTRCLDRSDNFRPALSGPNGKYFGMSRPGRTALWRNLLRDNQKPASALDAVISAHPPNGANGTYLSATRPSRSSRCPELASSYCLCHYRPTSACFCHRLYTSACRLPVACPSLARRSSRSAVPAALPLCPLCRSARSACSAVPASLPVTSLPVTCLPLQPACLQKKRDFPKSRFFIIRFGPSSAPPPDFLRVSPENLPGRAARGSWPNRPRDVSLRR